MTKNLPGQWRWGTMIRHSVALFVGTLWVTLASQVHAESLGEVVTQAVASHPSIEASRASSNAAIWDMKAAQSRLLPTLDGSANLGPFIIDQPEGFAPNVNNEWQFQRQLSLTVRQILFDGGDRSNDIRRSAALADATTYRILEQSENVALDAIEAYIDVRRLAAILELARQNRKKLSSVLELVKDLTSGGSAPASDLDQARERVAGASTIEKQIEQALAEVRARYRQVIGNEPHRLEKAKFPPGIPKSIKMAVDVALAKNPSIRALNSEAEAADFAVAQAKAGYMPTINLEGIATAGSDLAGTPGPMKSLSGQVTLQWNLYQGKGTTYRIRAFKERASKARLDVQVRGLQVVEVVERAYAAYTVGAQRVAATREQAAATKRVLTAYQQEYKGGKRSLLDLLDAQNASFTSQFQLASAEAVHVFSAYQLLGAMNQLLPTFGIAAAEGTRTDLTDQSRRSFYSIDIEPLR